MYTSDCVAFSDPLRESLSFEELLQVLAGGSMISVPLLERQVTNNIFLMSSCNGRIPKRSRQVGFYTPWVATKHLYSRPSHRYSH